MANDFVPALLTNNLSGDDSLESTQAFSQGHVEARLETSSSAVENETVSPSDALDWDKLSQDPKFLEQEGARIVLYPKVEGYRINPYNGKGEYSRWVDVDMKNQRGSAKVLLVAPGNEEIACRATYEDAISCFYFDPAHDSVVFLHYSSRNFVVSKLGSEVVRTVPRGLAITLSLGIWDIKFDGESLLEVLVLKRMNWLTQAISGAKRAAPIDDTPPKKLKLSNNRAAALIRAPPAPVNDHALVKLEKGTMIRLGSWPNWYWLTHLGTIFENNQTAVWRAKHSSIKVKDKDKDKDEDEDEDKDIIVKVTKTSRGYQDFKICVAKRWIRECQIHSSFDHPHIVRFLGMDARFHCLYLEHIDGRPLSAQVDPSSAKFTGTREVALRIIEDLASAISYVHSKNTVHGDIKPGNVLYNQTRGAVLIDFGLSFRFQNLAASKGCGTPWYLPPEFMLNGCLEGPKADIWAFGITMLWLLDYIGLPDTTRTEWNVGQVSLNGPAPRSSSEAIERMSLWIEFVESKRETFLLPGCTALERLVARALDPTMEARIDAASLCEQLQGLRLTAQQDDNTALQNQTWDPNTTLQNQAWDNNTALQNHDITGQRNEPWDDNTALQNQAWGNNTGLQNEPWEDNTALQIQAWDPNTALQNQAWGNNTTIQHHNNTGLQNELWDDNTARQIQAWDPNTALQIEPWDDGIALQNQAWGPNIGEDQVNIDY
ncbi:kinase-like domain-containing protein [Xylaria venustula]|nr:kinase-like domain-containing protein [Xylaria venustula]